MCEHCVLTPRANRDPSFIDAVMLQAMTQKGLGDIWSLSKDMDIEPAVVARLVSRQMCNSLLYNCGDDLILWLAVADHLGITIKQLRAMLAVANTLNDVNLV